MAFHSVTFLFFFLPCFILIYWLVPQRLRGWVGLLGSLGFYAWGEPYCVLALLAAIGANFALGLAIGRADKRRRLWLWLGCCFNLGLLFVFKYLGFFAGLFGRELSLYLPIGLSFFVFQALSYLVDVYRGTIPAERSFLPCALYFSFFPKMMQGPLMRYGDLSRQLPPRPALSDLSDGCFRFAVGLGKKLLLSAPLGVLADSLCGSNALTTAGAWLGLLAYGMQLYFDFSGYSDMAIALGRMMGFRLPENFRYPYLATSVSDFWRRWHMTLGLWFRDYVYFPLGGSRVPRFKLIRNLLIVWTLTGFWHGASWNYLLWGFYFGLLLCAEKLLRLEKRKIPIALRRSVTLLAVFFGWVFFRSSSAAQAFDWFAALFGHGALCCTEVTLALHDNLAVLLCGLVACTPLLSKLGRSLDARFPQTGLLLRSVITLLLLAACTVSLVNSNYTPFLYLRF